jgi:hypothetical protein
MVDLAFRVLLNPAMLSPGARALLADFRRALQLDAGVIRASSLM